MNNDDKKFILTNTEENLYRNILSDALFEEILENKKKAKILDEVRRVVPIGNLNTDKFENLPARIDYFIKKYNTAFLAIEYLEDFIDYIEDNVAIETSNIQFQHFYESAKKFIEHVNTEIDE